MDYTMMTAGSETHVGVVAIALVLSIILALIGIAASG